MMPELPGDPPQPLAAAFRPRFGGEPAVMASAPGRVELLGNHTDYNGGLVIAAAIDRKTVFVGRQIPGRQARVASVQFDELDTFSLDAIEPTQSPAAWTRYVRGVCWALTEWCGPLSSGFDAVFAGNVPLGCGSFELGKPAGGMRDVPDRARRRAGTLKLRIDGRRWRRPSDGARSGLAAIGKRIRRRRLGPARPVFEPLRPRRAALFSLIAAPRFRPPAAGSPRAVDRRVRLANLAPAGRRDVQPETRRMRSDRGCFQG